MTSALRIPVLLHRAFVRAVDDDVFNIAQSAAYSAIVALFPALIVAASFISYLPHAAPIRYELSLFFSRILPSAAVPLLQGYFRPGPHTTSARALLVATALSVWSSSGVIVTFMEGIRRAHLLPSDCWSFWQRRRRALALVPLSLLPLAAASLLVVFGHILTLRLMGYVPAPIRIPVYFVALLARWSVALTGSIGLIALLYHMGTPARLAWRSALPGALIATLLWLPATLLFGWYVTRFANYSRVYGSLGAGIALLFWLYIISLSTLCGAEYNAAVLAERASPPHPRPTNLEGAPASL